MKRGRKINEGFYSHVGSDGEKRKDGLIDLNSPRLCGQ